MAQKPTIYKMRIALSDLERNYYQTLSLTLALHPSETAERMLARVLAYCINASDDLVFSKGLSEVDEPDIWVRSMDEKTLLWIDVGEPSFERMKKSSRQADRVLVYSFNSKSEVWWEALHNKASRLKVGVYRIDYQTILSFATLLERTMDMSVTITGESAFISTGKGEVEVSWSTLQDRR